MRLIPGLLALGVSADGIQKRREDVDFKCFNIGEIKSNNAKDSMGCPQVFDRNCQSCLQDLQSCLQVLNAETILIVNSTALIRVINNLGTVFHRKYFFYHPRSILERSHFHNYEILSVQDPLSSETFTIVSFQKVIDLYNLTSL